MTPGERGLLVANGRALSVLLRLVDLGLMGNFDRGMTEKSLVSLNSALTQVSDENDSGRLVWRGRPTKEDDVISWVAAVTGVSVLKIKGKSRLQDVVRARWLAMHLLHMFLGSSSVQLGAMFGRDHTSVLHALRNIDRSYPQLDEISKAAKRELNLG